MSYVYAGRRCYLALVLELHSCITLYAAVCQTNARTSALLKETVYVYYHNC
jgi:hypothetical protein